MYNLKGGIVAMKKVFLSIYRCIVGPEYGFIGEGNEQWYYSLALAMNLMLIWWLKPEVALLFTILAVIHYLTVALYGYFDMEFEDVIFSYSYFGIHLIILAIALLTSFKWAFITMAITIVAFLSAPDCTGDNIFPRKSKFQDRLPLLCNTIIFVAFIVIDFLLPINLLFKFAILVVALIIHPVIDFLEGEGIIISDITFGAIGRIKECKDSKKYH